MTQAEFTIIGILKQKSTHAYQIEKQLQKENLKDKVDLAFSSIYNILKKMLRKKLVTSHLEKNNKLPDRKVYEVTDLGDQKFTEYLQQHLSLPRTIKSSFELCLHFSNFITVVELKNALTTYEAELNRMIQKQVQQITKLKTNDPITRALYNRSLRLWQAEKQWLKELIIMI